MVVVGGRRKDGERRGCVAPLRVEGVEDVIGVEESEEENRVGHTYARHDWAEIEDSEATIVGSPHKSLVSVKDERDGRLEVLETEVDVCDVLMKQLALRRGRRGAVCSWP